MASTMTEDMRSLEEAAEWQLWLAEAPDQARPAHDAWLAQSEAHRVAWARVSRTWAVTDGLAAPPLQALPPGAGRGRTQPRAVPRPGGGASSLRRGGQALMALGAAVVLWLTLPGLWLALQADYRTGAGETRQIALADGTRIDLAPDSAIAAKGRAVRLLAGEAFFEVAHDPAHPFTVRADGAEVTVLGTAFDMRRGREGTQVALQSGRIALAAGAARRELLPGQAARISPAGRVTLETVAPAEIGSWRQGQVWLDDVSLAEAAELIGRSLPGWVIVPSRSLAQARVSGLFDLRRPDAALAALVRPFGGSLRQPTPFTRILTR